MLASKGMGMIERRNAYPSGRKSRVQYRLYWSLANSVERDALVSFLGSVSGGGDFTWTPPGETAGTFRMLSENTDVTFKSEASHRIVFLVEEV